tara:strand:- start:55 stop:291 length:237 start_codon:yes stop_codon:yes gene_type:complete
MYSNKTIEEANKLVEEYRVECGIEFNCRPLSVKKTSIKCAINDVENTIKAFEGLHITMAFAGETIEKHKQILNYLKQL